MQTEFKEKVIKLLAEHGDGGEYLKNTQRQTQ